MSRILVTGSSSGLGSAIASALRLANHHVIEFDALSGHDVRDPARTWEGEYAPEELDVLINCAGVNRLGWLENYVERDWDDVMDTNVKGIFKMVQWCLPSLAAMRGTIINIVSNASHIPMTCSSAYNASKGAAHILTLQMARELGKRYGLTVFGISPNKMEETEMSRALEPEVMLLRGWTKEEVRAYQLAALPAGTETPPALIAELITFLLSSRARHRFLTGTILPYGA